MATHCNKPKDDHPGPARVLHITDGSNIDVAIPNCPEISVSLREKAGKTYIRVMRDEHPAVRVVINQATGDVEVTRQTIE